MGTSDPRSSWRQLKAMLRKNWLLKIRHPFSTLAEILLPTIIMLSLIAIRTRVDTQIHPVQANVRKGMFVEVGNSEVSASFDSLLKLLLARNEHLAFAPDTNEMRKMLDALSLRYPLLQMVILFYEDELALETYIRSELYGSHDNTRNLSNPKIRGAIVLHEHGPQMFDYSIRLNHTWAFSGFPDVKTIMDVNGPYLNDLELGASIVPTLQYGFSGFLTLQQVMDTLIISIEKQDVNYSDTIYKMDETFQLFGSPRKLNSSEFIPTNIRIVPFPTREYTDDEFQSLVKAVMGVLYLLGFLFPISRLISYSVFEKEQKIKEGLQMMGLRNKTFYLSWFITYTLQFAISSAIITATTANSLFKYSDKSLVFIYFFLFSLSAIMLSFFISTFFSRAKTAVAVGSLSFIGAFFPYYSVNDPSIPMVWKISASLLSPAAFALGTINFADYERAHVGVRWTNMWQASSGVNFMICLLMMLLDTIIYCFFGLCFEKVLPREGEVLYSWKFLFHKLILRKKVPFNDFDSPDLQTYELPEEECHFIDGSFESISFDMKQQEIDGRCIKIMNLHKVYTSKKGKCCAVNFLNLSLYENQILALLGHNGAGKSSTISMLVGLIPPTSGDALVFGKKITTDIADIRKVLGVCPQHDILFSELTVKEHMVMCAALKGVDEDYLESNVTEMINEVGLADKVNSVVGTLSGGMKRKLSLGIALIGNSKVIILDEPTSGMDPYAMRSTWQLIKKIKKGRIILLTTHSMDEADILGDRIAIMASGRLRCCGSSLFLKNRYGVGYTLTIAKTSPGSSVGAEIVHHHVPAAECISDVGSEFSFRLPLASSSLFVNMFREIESCIRRPNIEDNSSFVESDCGIESYGISVTTLEEVFLKVAGQRLDEVNFHQYQMNLDKSDAPDCQVSQITLSGLAISKRYCGYSCELFIWFLCAAGQVCSLVVSNIYGFTVLTLVKLCSCGTIVKSVFWVHLKALFIKRAISARRDSKTVAFQLLIPAIFMLLGLLFLRIKPHPDQGSVELTTSHFNPLLSGGGGGGPIPFNLYSPVAEKVASYVMGGWIQNAEPRSFRFPQPEKVLTDAIEAAGPKLGPLLLSMSEYLISSLNESYQSRYGAVVMDDLHADGSLGYTILHNCSCQHAAPTFINLVNAAILRLATGNSNKTIRIRNHPLPLTMSQHAQRHDLDAFSASVIVSMAFSFIPASYAVSIVKEREVKAKQQQLISGVSIFAYWISTFLWDFFSFLFPASLAVFLFFIFDLKQFVGYDCLLPTIMIFLEYGAAVAASTYCLTFFFTDHSIAQNVVLLVHFLGGLILMVISFIMGLVNATQTANSFLKNFFRLSPAFCFADGLASLALRHQDMKLGSKHQILDWKVTGASLCYLAVEIVVYFIMTISLEYIPHYKIKLTISKVWCNLFHYVKYDTSQSYSEPLLGSSSMFMTDEDVDVIAERQRILNGLGDNAIICLQNLRKVYPAVKKHAAKVAVHSLTFAVHEGECFGFLGTNGAGKTTTLSMLTGEECPTDGTAYVFGTEVRSNPKSARQHIGYCPQFDALFEFLTPREHLMLYAKIKYVPEDIINDVVNEKLVEFDLWNHAEKPAYTLSGGNKRKLSVAIAMIGDPPIVILDEPSTGMDPIAKRFMWDVISNLSTRRGKTAVILTTHSMNEAQALCTRIGIMVDGKLRCLGSPQHLKSRYGNHLELELKPTEVSTLEVDDLCNNIQEMLYDFPKDARGILGDLETCILGSSIVASKSIAEISLTTDMIILIANLFGNENSIKTIISSNPVSDGVFGEQLSEQLLRDGSIPLRIFCEWWLAKQKFTQIDSFILASFPGAKFHGCNGLSVKYELPYGEDSSLADIFGHLENNRRELGIEDYRISQATLETIFNDFAGGAA